jgi:hypothetical protein
MAKTCPGVNWRGFWIWFAIRYGAGGFYTHRPGLGVAGLVDTDGAKAAAFMARENAVIASAPRARCFSAVAPSSCSRPAPAPTSIWLWRR